MNSYLIYSVKDVVSGNFCDLQLFLNKPMARRWFDNLCKKSEIAKDLQLFEIGTFDLKTGTISCNVEFICGGVENE